MTLGEVAHAAAALLSVDNFATAFKAANLRYQELVTGRKMLHLRRIFEVVVPALIDTGTVTMIKGSKEVVGDATAQEAWTKDIVGRYVLVKNVFYEIADLQPNKTIILTTPYIEVDVTDGGYKIIDRKIKLDRDVAQVGSMVNMSLRIPIRTQDQDYTNVMAPARSSIASGPIIASSIGEDPDGSPIYEFYPYSNLDTAVQYTGYINPPELAVDDRVPNAIPVTVLIEGIQADLMKAEMSKALQKGDPNGAALWRNDYRAQQTVWNRMKNIAYRNDVATDDATFILQTSFGHSQLPQDFDAIRDARAQVWFNTP